VATEVQTPGCWGTLAGQPAARAFSMLCGDGKVATVTLDDQGQVADRQLSDKLFDADQDAWFNTAERIGDRFFFISFKGTLTELDLSGPAAKVLGSRPIAGSPQDDQARLAPGRLPGLCRAPRRQGGGGVDA
jgi:methylamine dehydrogenase heavy chain